MNNRVKSTEEKICISIAEMAMQLGISLTSAYQLAHRKEFYPTRRIGGRIMIDFQSLKQWLEGQRI